MNTTNTLLSPFQKFVNLQSLSGILLLSTTLLAMAWANSPWSQSYFDLWSFKLGITSSVFELNKPLLLWVNDGLMAIFFFLIGLEIKRELLIGELNSVKKAMFPLMGAIGGMTVPVILFLLLNNNPQTQSGWGIPMATDIAFSLAILKVLGKHIPLSLKVFLTAFAIVDDIGAVLVIALFYSSNIQYELIGYAGILLTALSLLSYKRLYSKQLNIIVGVVVWILFLKAGIHPTLAGILLAFAVPVRQRIKMNFFLPELNRIIGLIEKDHHMQQGLLSKKQIAHIDNLEDLTTKFQSPLQHLEHQLHNWVAYLIIPIFAFANAGVAISNTQNLDTSLIYAIITALFFGNSVGITSMILIAKKLKIINIPNEIKKRHIIGVSFLAGVGFTMSVFICSLAYAGQPDVIDAGKIGIIIGSALSGLSGYLILRYSHKLPGRL